MRGLSRGPVLLAAAVLAGMAGFAGDAEAQAYPTKALTMLVPFGAGGTADIICREAAEALAAGLGKPVAVENRLGGGGAIAANAVVKAAPDGHTILCGSNSLFILQALRNDLGYDVTKDLEPVAPLVEGAFGIFVHPNFPAKTMAELVDAAKKNPGKYNYASSGIGSAQHIAAAKLFLSTGVELTHIPYAGGAETLIATIQNETQVLVIDAAAGKPNADTGKLRLLAIGAEERSSLFPDVPTAIQAGVPGYAPTFWYAIYAPAGTPGAIVARISQILQAKLTDPQIRKKYADQGYRAIWTPADALKTKIRTEVDDWKQVVAATGIKLQ